MAGRMTYSEQLKHPLWQRRRLEILSRADFKCERCESTEKTLHVHHKQYRKGAKAWEYEDHDLIALCEDCHSAEHLTREELQTVLAQLDLEDMDELIGFAKSLLLNREWENDHDQEKLVAVRNWSQAHGLAKGIGLEGIETDYLLCRNQIPVTELLTIDVAATQRRTARGRLKQHARTTDELVQMGADAIAAAPRPDTGGL